MGLEIGGISSIISSALGASASMYNAHRANQASKHSASGQMQWEEKMSNTAVQRRMKDLEEAGINPILAGDLTATTPAGATYSAQQADVSALGNNPYEKYLEQEQTKKTTEATENAGHKSEAEAHQTNELTPVLKTQSQTASGKNIAETAAAKAMEKKANAEAERITLDNNYIKEHPYLYAFERIGGSIGSALNGGGAVTNAITHAIHSGKQKSNTSVNYHYNINK